MSARLPLLILDEIMLPGTTGEVGLEPREAEQLRARGAADREIPLLVASRPPGTPPPTALEQRAQASPGPLVEAALLGQGQLAPPDDDPIPRVVLSETRRVRLADVASGELGWEAAAEAWPMRVVAADGDTVDTAEVAELASRFYRALLVSRDPGEGGLRAQIEGPISEIEAARDEPVNRLLLLADYLFEAPGSRLAVLLSADAGELRHQVGDALELLEAGLPGGRRAIGATLQAYLSEAGDEGLASLGRAAAVLRATAPLVATGETARQAAALAMELEDLQDRFDRLAERLLKASLQRR